MHHAKCKEPDTRDAHGIAWLQLHDILENIKSQEGGINECLPQVGKETDWREHHNGVFWGNKVVLYHNDGRDHTILSFVKNP